MKILSGNRKAFTLIELLVVIAIIAMLLAILMPALNTVKKQASQVVCMANLSQWGLILTLYTEDNNGHFFAGYYDYADPNGVIHQSGNADLWPYALQSYYEVPKLKFCPSARDPWGSKSDEVFSGSYGLNGWLGDTPGEVVQTEGHDTANSWRTMDHSGSSKIPLMADANWYTGRPESYDLPPKEEGKLFHDKTAPPIDDINHMQRFSVNRHRKKLNVLFMDGTVKSTSPKKLWRLKWHQNFNTSAPLPEWPEWMN